MASTIPFRILALPVEPFASFFRLSDAELMQRGARRCVADKKPGFPCRVSLVDAEPGERVILLPLPTTRLPLPIRRPARSSCVNRRVKQRRPSARFRNSSAGGSCRSGPTTRQGSCWIPKWPKAGIWKPRSIAFSQTLVLPMCTFIMLGPAAIVAGSIALDKTLERSRDLVVVEQRGRRFGGPFRCNMARPGFSCGQYFRGFLTLPCLSVILSSRNSPPATLPLKRVGPMPVLGP
jgi:hypothetical protein